MSTHPLPPFLADFDEDALESEGSTVVALDGAGVIVWVNGAWARFARANGGEGVAERFGEGARYLDGISGPLREFYQRVFGEVLSSNRPFELDYDCPSPQSARRYHLRVLPIANKGLLVEHSLIAESAEANEAPSPDRDLYTDRNDGIVLQCSNCRRVRRADGGGWDRVPAWTGRSPANTSHGLCPVCASFYWGALARREKDEGLRKACASRGERDREPLARACIVSAQCRAEHPLLVSSSMGSKILVVDDDEPTRRVLAKLLRGEGHEVDACADGESAYEQLRAHDYDVVVTDHVMKGLTGVELVRRARAELGRRFRGVVVSGYAPTAESEQQGLSWLGKPLDVEQLLAAIAA